ncbi:MAG: Rieske 2Fe-2S domain-containing protein [Betaproteobacteria bacterium]|nr:Rieske 2Fe-2S domain-containing protein [Betaproteobacteria bacterium]
MAAREHLICEASRLVDGGDGVCFDAERAHEITPAFVVRHGGRVFGWLNRCAHRPMRLDLLPGKFFDQSGLYLICATHGAVYMPDTGLCVAGPCSGGALVPVGVEERDGLVFWKQATE